MARFDVVGDFAFDMTTFTFDYFTSGTISDRSSGSFLVNTTALSRVDHFNGSDFAYDPADTPSSGLITRFERIHAAASQLIITNLAVTIYRSLRGSRL